MSERWRHKEPRTEIEAMMRGRVADAHHRLLHAALDYELLAALDQYEMAPDSFNWMFHADEGFLLLGRILTDHLFAIPSSTFSSSVLEQRGVPPLSDVQLEVIKLMAQTTASSELFVSMLGFDRHGAEAITIWRRWLKGTP